MRPTIRQLGQSLCNHAKDPFNILSYLTVCEPKRCIPLFQQTRIPALVPACIVRISIHFNYQPLRGTKEITDKVTYNMLSPEFIPTKLGSGKIRPKLCFEWRGFFSHLGGVKEQVFVLVHDGPTPTPPLKGRGFLGPYPNFAIISSGMS